MFSINSHSKISNGVKFFVFFVSFKSYSCFKNDHLATTTTKGKTTKRQMPSLIINISKSQSLLDFSDQSFRFCSLVLLLLVPCLLLMFFFLFCFLGFIFAVADDDAVVVVVVAILLMTSSSNASANYCASCYRICSIK